MMNDSETLLRLREDHRFLYAALKTCQEACRDLKEQLDERDQQLREAQKALKALDDYKIAP